MTFRALETFGVAGLLEEDCEIYYDSLFNVKNVGRISDLLAARLGDLGSNDLRLRTLLLYSVFEVFNSQKINPGEQPLVLECGKDKERIAIGVSLNLPVAPDIEALDKLLSEVQHGSGQPTNPGLFEKLLIEICLNSDNLVIRFHPETLRFEVVSLLGANPNKDKDKDNAVQIVVLEGEVPDAPKPKQYIQLADMDYAAILAEERRVGGGQVPTGQLLVEGLPVDGLTTIQTRSAPKQETFFHKISGVTQNLLARVTKIAGNQTTGNDFVATIKGGGEFNQGRDIRVLVGDAQTPGQEGGLHSPRVTELERRIAELEAEKLALAKGIPGSPSAEMAQTKVGGFLKKLWPFNRANGLNSESAYQHKPQEWNLLTSSRKNSFAQGEPGEGDQNSSDSQTAAENLAQAGASDSSGSSDIPELAEVSVAVGELNVAEAVSGLMNEIQTGGFETVLKKAKVEVISIKQEVQSQRAKAWMDGFIGELLTEKSKLQEKAKQLNISTRQKEIEFRSKEAALRDELHKRDEVIRQKTNMLARSKDQLVEMTMAVEKAKTNNRQSSSEDLHHKQKLNIMQKMLNASKDENAQLQAKLESLKAQLQTAGQLAGKTRGGPSQTEYAVLQTKLDRTMHQFDELKKANAQLTEKLAEGKKDKLLSANVEEMKKRVEAATKQASTRQKEVEQTQLKLDESEREQTKLKMELGRLQAELRSAKKASGSKAA